MARITPAHYRTLSKFFEKHGFKLKRQRGDHLVYTKEGVKRPIITPKYKKIPVFIILNNLRTANITRQQYLQETTK